MSAPQLPNVALYGDWFCPDTAYHISAVGPHGSLRSSGSSHYSQRTATASLRSAKTSISFEPSSQDVVQDDLNFVTAADFLRTAEDPAKKQSMAFISEATPDNSYLGFCKSAWTLQNGDQKGSMKTCNEASAYSRSGTRTKPGTAQYLKCREPKCEFRSNFISSNTFLIWNKVFTYEKHGIKLRWPFLAKSHVPQRVVLNSQYCFQCLFCAFLGRHASSTIYNGMDSYLDHIDKEHRGQALGDVIEYKTRCISTRIALDGESFDINIWPVARPYGWEVSTYLSKDLLKQRQDQRVLVTPRLPSTHVSRDNGAPRSVIENEVNVLQQGKTDDGLASPSSQATDSTMTSQSFHYQPWEDNPAEIWGQSASEARPSCDSLSLVDEHHESSAVLLHGSQPRPATPLSPSPVDPATHDLTASVMQLQIHTRPGRIETPDDSRVGITSCLESIVQIFREAGAIIDAIKDNLVLSHAPIVGLLAESVKDAPSEIEREKNRATLRFGEAFQRGDYIAVHSLQQVALQLHDGFLKLLQQAVYECKLVDIARLVDDVDSGRHTTISCLHKLKQRLVQSGSGAYQQPGPLSHPAHQSLRHLEAYKAPQANVFTNFCAAEGQYYMSGGIGSGHVEEGSAHSLNSATSNDTSLHVHFRKEDITEPTAQRRGSIMGFLKHGRTKSSNFIVDSKRKSDELAESRRKGFAVPRFEKQKRKVNASRELNEVVVGIAELDGIPVVGYAK